MTEDQLLHRNNGSIGSDDSAAAQYDVLPIPSLEGILYIPLDQLIWMKADGSYTHIFSVGRAKQVLCKRLGQLEQVLPEHFFRCHRSYLINLRKVLRVYRVGGFRVELHCGTRLEVSKRNWSDLLRNMAHRCR